MFPESTVSSLLSIQTWICISAVVCWPQAAKHHSHSCQRPARGFVKQRFPPAWLYLSCYKGLPQSDFMWRRGEGDLTKENRCHHCLCYLRVRSQRFPNMLSNEREGRNSGGFGSKIMKNFQLKLCFLGSGEESLSRGWAVCHKKWMKSLPRRRFGLFTPTCCYQGSEIVPFAQLWLSCFEKMLWSKKVITCILTIWTRV